MGWAAGVQFPVGSRDFSPLHNVEAVSGAQPLVTGGSFPWGKTALT
jgi:hypothetical protein